MYGLSCSQCQSTICFQQRNEFLLGEPSDLMPSGQSKVVWPLSARPDYGMCANRYLKVMSMFDCGHGGQRNVCTQNWLKTIINDAKSASKSSVVCAVIIEIQSASKSLLIFAFQDRNASLSCFTAVGPWAVQSRFTMKATEFHRFQYITGCLYASRLCSLKETGAQVQNALRSTMLWANYKR